MNILSVNKYQNIAIDLLAIVGVLHDWGKFNDWFQYKLAQKKILADPYRHEFISCKLIERAYHLYKENWLKEISNGKEFPINYNDYGQSELNEINSKLPTYVKIICYLVLTHHRLPNLENFSNNELKNIEDVFTLISSSCGYYNESSQNKKFKIQDEMNCFCFSRKNVFNEECRNIIKEHMNNLQNYDFESLINSNDFHNFIYFVRMYLMLADYKVSSDKNPTQPVKKSKIAWANKNEKNYYCQTVNEHCFLVAKKSMEIAQETFPLLQKLPSVHNEFLNQSSPIEFNWQDKAVKQIKNHKNANYFCVNMASTGKGKTMANAKIINAMNNELRYTLAVGLRTLVLQTGNDYLKKVNFLQEDISICIGDETYTQLFNMNNKEEENDITNINDNYVEDLMHEQNGYEIEFDSMLKDENIDFLNPIFQTKKYKAFIYKPVLVCTIDYLVRITQTWKGGKYIIPLMRMLTSDLVIDEIDDFSIKDLKVIQRLVYLTGMFGRNFIMSSATIPPDLALGFYKAYKKGLDTYNQFTNQNKSCVVVLCDEFKATSSTNINIYNDFINERVCNLINTSIKKHHGKILRMDKTELSFFNTITTNIFSFHKYNHIKINKHNVSIGCIRLANINTCVETMKHILALRADGYTIKALCYHSRQIMLLRNEEEVYLQKVLNRKNNTITDPLMLDIINNGEKNVIFIVVATPIEEIGRDHDFDWTIIEPSSIHSIIQMCGRVLRHRSMSPKKCNIGILQYNYAYIKQKYAMQDGKYFKYPGVESNADIRMQNYDVRKLIPKNFLKHITSEPLINFYNNKHQTNFTSLIEAEHYQASKVNDFISIGALNIHGFTEEYWYLLNSQLKFREQTFITEDYFTTINQGAYHFIHKNTKTEFQVFYEKIDETNLWFKRDYSKSIQNLSQKLNESNMQILFERFGGINILLFNNSSSKIQYKYNDNLGIYYEKI